jgi:phosphate/sulfate permease
MGLEEPAVQQDIKQDEKKEQLDTNRALKSPEDPEMGGMEVEDAPATKKSAKAAKTWGDWWEETFVDDKYFWLIIVILFIANIGIYRSTFLGRWVGFCLSAYSAIANDSIQTLGTFIASNSGVFAWWKQWAWIGIIFVFTMLYSWFTEDGDISYGRLASKGYDKAPVTFNYLQTAAPIILLVLTRLKIPVSTTFCILTSFVGKVSALNKTILKSASGYVISFGLAVLVYIPFSKMVSNYCDRTRGSLHWSWTGVQWLTTGVLWSVWLQQDMSNIAVFLPRKLNVLEMIFAVAFIAIGLGVMLYQGGEKIQAVVDEKSRVKDVPEATLVDLIFAIVLFVFKLASKIPMSTTWCFVGLLAGRELSMAIRKAGSNTLGDAFQMSLKDLLSVCFGFIVSLIWGAMANKYPRFAIIEFLGGTYTE